MLTKLQTLKAMGIEVWTHRESNTRMVGSASGLLMPTSVEQRGSEEPKQISSGDEELVIPSFRFAMLDYGSLGICLSLPEEAVLPRRFCDDVARFMAADLEGLKLQIFEWPMLDTSGIDQSIDAAREVVTQKLGALPAQVIVIGENVSDYFEPLKKVGDEGQVLIGEQSYLFIPSLTELLKFGSKKRRLMALLARWQ